MDLYKNKYLKYKKKYNDLKNMKGGAIKVGDEVEWSFQEHSTVLEDSGAFLICKTDLGDVRVYPREFLMFIDPTKDKSVKIRIGDRVKPGHAIKGINKITFIDNHRVTILTDYGNIYIPISNFQ
jgi:hypothetical protein